jgi:flagellar protein FliO/FliZ
LTELVLRIGFSLLVVFGLMWLLARVVRRPLGSGRQGAVTVLNRQQLSRGAAVAVIRFADRAMIVGVTDQQVSLLGEANIEEFEKQPAAHRDPILAGRPDTDLLLPGIHPASRPDRSMLSPRHWASSTIDFLRDRTTRQ